MRSNRLPSLALGLVVAGSSVIGSAAAAGPPPTPTPAARSLAELAARLDLARENPGETAGAVVISNQTLAALAAGGRLTIVPPRAAPDEPEAAPARSAPARSRARDEGDLRLRWRTRVNAQRDESSGGRPESPFGGASG